jgi:hypothetical protein
MVVLHALFTYSMHSYMRYTFMHAFFLENKTLKMFRFQFITLFECILLNFYRIFEEFLRVSLQD